MTRDDLVNYVCTKTQQLQPNDISACQLFASKRYEMIYNSQLWKDSLTIVALQFDPVNNPDNASGVLVLPQQIDRVVACRTQFNSVRINNLENYYRVDYDAFTANASNFWGTAAEFAILYPIWTAIGPATPTWTAVTVSGVYSSPHGFPANSIQISNAATVFKLTAGPNEVSINLGGIPLVDGQTYIFQSLGIPFFIIGQSGLPFSGTFSSFSPTTTTQSYGPGATFTISSSDASDSALQVKVIWRDRRERFIVTQNLPVTLTPVDGTGFCEIEAVFKPQTKGTLSLTINNSISGVDGAGNPTTFIVTQPTGLTIAPTDLTTAKQSRIRVFAIPSVLTTIFVLGKKPFVPLDFPQEVPLIKNVDNCLIAFTMADMLERARQFGKAQQQMTEGSSLLQDLVSLEAIQAANHEQFKPDAGYGDAFFGPNGIGYRGGIF